MSPTRENNTTDPSCIPPYPIPHRFCDSISEEEGRCRDRRWRRWSHGCQNPHTESSGRCASLRAQDYLGGRVKTLRAGPLLVEEGAGWISGGSANPLFSLAKRLGGMNSPVKKESYDWRAKTSNGRNADPSGFDVTASLMEECDVDPALVPYHSTGYGRCFLDK
ncbi:uncharacterized protein [Macrobrachium rosenbergii]|uniref:uncharacterized protein n=1 Tax=Macrobrachium rosenbergii TaxID=79674 RepID=UPI0034D568CA